LPDRRKIEYQPKILEKSVWKKFPGANFRSKFTELPPQMEKKSIRRLHPPPAGVGQFLLWWIGGATGRSESLSEFPSTDFRWKNYAYQLDGLVAAVE
jgi:hypothetical protein